MCECRIVWGCIVLWLKRGGYKRFGSMIKVWSKDESCDYIGID